MSFFSPLVRVLRGQSSDGTVRPGGASDGMRNAQRKPPTLPTVKRRRIISFISLLLILTGSITLTLVNTTISRAAVVTWDGGGSTNNWSDCTNWSTDICPTSTDTVTFDATSTKDATVDPSFSGSIISLTINAGYTGTISLARSLQTTSAFSQAGGTFTAGSQTLDVNGTFTLSNGVFNASSDIMTFASTFTISGSPTFNANGGIVAFDGSSSTITCNNVTFNLVTIVSLSSSTKTIGSTCSLPLGNNPSIRPITLNGTLSGTGTLTITNTSNVSFNAGANLVGFTGLVRGGNFIIAGATLDLGSYTTVDINGSFSINSGTFTAPSETMTVTAGLQFTGGTFNANGGTVSFDAGSNSYIDCQGAPFNNVSFANDSISSHRQIYAGCTLPLGNNPSIGTGVITNKGTLSGTGTLTAQGMILDSTSVLTGFSGLVVNGDFNNNGATTSLSGYTTADFNETFTLTSGTFTAPTSPMSVAGDFTYTDGTYESISGTLTFDGADSTISCDSILINQKVVFNHTGTKTIADPCNLPLGANPSIPSAISLSGTLSGTGTLTHSGDLTYNTFATFGNFTSIQKPSGNFIIAGGNFNNTNNFTTVDVNDSLVLTSGEFTAPRITLTVGGNFTHAGGTFNHNNATVVLDGSNQTLSGSTTFYNLTKATSTSDTLTFTNGTTQTITNTLTLQGATGQLLSLVSNTVGQQWNIDPQGTRTLRYLRVRDSRNTNSNAITGDSTVIDLGNNSGWTFTAPTSTDDEDASTGTSGTATTTPSPSPSPTSSASPTGILATTPGLQSTTSPSTDTTAIPATETPAQPVDTSAPVPTVVIKTIGSRGQSITGAKVGLYSTPRSTISDTNGVAVFQNIEVGEHQLIVAYRDKIAIQRLNVDKSGAVSMLNASENSSSSAENELTVSLEDSSPIVPIIVLVVSRIAAGLLALIVYLIYIRRRPDLDYLGLGPQVKTA